MILKKRDKIDLTHNNKNNIKNWIFKKTCLKAFGASD
jgi:hypothetical protein